MSDIAVRVENVSKRYRIGVREARQDTFIGAIGDWVRRPVTNMRRLNRLSRFSDEETDDVLWALRDISFDVRPGEVVGVVGRNGAGKSTLLKLLSRITFPTKGRILLNGRVSSLLEVGTGFHPELNGRENIYLNGTILGMTKREIDLKYDEIVDFSGVEKFIDTPVKRYSSGMRVRLAFSVAAHLEPEILLIDEVLAVGDANFQRKCLGKMGEVAGEGRTVLFVSHNLVALSNLCERSFLLEGGMLTKSGPTKSIISHYLAVQREKITGVDLKIRLDRRGNQFLRFRRVEIFDARTGETIDRIASGMDIRIRLYYSCGQMVEGRDISVSIVVKDNEYALTNINSTDRGRADLVIYPEGFFECSWPNFNLTAGAYDCSIFCSIDGVVADWIDMAFALIVEDGDFYGAARKIGFQSKFLVNYDWASSADEKAGVQGQEE